MNLRLRASTVVVYENQLLTFLAEDPHNGREFFFLPGGQIEKHETAPEAAVRETLEETGYHIEVETISAIDSEYDFFWNGQTHHCLTLFYRGSLTSPFATPAKVAACDYHKKVVWLPLDQIKERLSYSPAVLQATLELLKR